MYKAFLEDLKSRISIVDVVSSRIRLQRKGTCWTALCPFHKEKTGSFRVDESKGLYYCFGCHAGGDAIKFIMEFDKVSFQEAVEIIAEQLNMPVPHPDEKLHFEDPNERLYKIMDIAKKYFAKNLFDKNNDTAMNYLNIRNIHKECIEKFHLGFAPNNSELYNLLKQQKFLDDELIASGIFVKSSYNNELVDRYKGRLIFPIIDAFGRCVGFGGRLLEKSNNKAKYINSPETDIYVKSNQLYGYHLAKRCKSRQIVIVEGYLDVISMHQAGFDGAVAPLGTSISSNQINMCWKICNNPVIMLDGDSAGVTASYRWIDKILEHLEPGKSFKFAALPQDTDPDMLVYNKQVPSLSEAIENAIPLSDWLWEGAFALFPSQTPEENAELVQMLMEKAKSIKNDTIRNFYIQDIRNREKSLYRRKKKPIKYEKITSVGSAREKIEKILVAAIVNHPYIMDRVVEEFVKLEFEDPEVRKVKEEIVGYYAKFTNDMPQFKEALQKMHINFKGIGIHANFVSEEVADEEVIKKWFELQQRFVYKPSLDRDLHDAFDDFAFSVDDWRRLKALKSETVLNHRVK